MAQLLSEVRAGFKAGKTRPLAYRRGQLERLLRLCDENQEGILDALYADLRKTRSQGLVMEVNLAKIEVRGALKNLEKWAKDESPGRNLLYPGDTAYIRKEPLGVVLIIGAWNFPFLLCMRPLVGAIAAGNCAVVKVSEVAPNTGALIARLVPKYLDQDCFRVIEGDVAATIKLLEEKFDCILATGSPAVGRSVMAAAAKHLTPVTLELGGKNPVYIDDEVELEIAARRIWWTKATNLGQLCVSPDYILISKKREQEFVDKSRKVLNQMFGSAWKKSGDLSRIVNERHFLRLKKILDTTKGTVAFGGETDQTDLWISPTIIVGVDASADSAMEDEIFGPILPIVNVESPEEAIELINARPKPLALYVFNDNKKQARSFIERTSSGGACINDCFLQYSRVGLPFGGVGESGMGNYHGEFTFNTFSHKRAIVERKTSALSELIFKPRFAPFTAGKVKLMQLVMSHEHMFIVPRGIKAHLLSTLLGVGVVFAIYYAAIK